MEIGSGVAALPSMTALRCGASKVVITEQSHLDKVCLGYLLKNNSILVSSRGRPGSRSRL